MQITASIVIKKDDKYDSEIIGKASIELSSTVQPGERYFGLLFQEITESLIKRTKELNATVVPVQEAATAD